MSSPHPLRILVIAPTPFFSDRGCHIRINEECQALQSIGHTIKIVAYGIGKNVSNLDIERIKNFSSYTKTSAGPSWYKILFDFLLMFKTRSAIRQFKPDIIHAHLHEGVCIAWGARVLALSRTPVLFDAQGSLVAEMKSYSKKQRLWFFTLLDIVERWIFRVSSAVAVSSESMFKLVKATRLAPASVPVILAADSANRVPVLSNKERLRLRSEHHIPTNARVFVYCGGMTNDKGVELFYEAVLPLMAADTSLYVVWIGGPEATLNTRAEADRVNDRMRFLGNQPFATTHRLSQLGDIAVDPKPPTSSQASGKMLNYMAAGLPIVTFDSENRNMIDPENFFASPANVDGLRDALRKSLSKTSEELGALGQKNSAHLDAHFSWKATAEVLSVLYKQLLQK